MIDSFQTELILEDFSHLVETPPTATDLTTADRAELGRYERVIERGLMSFMEVGTALIAIRDGKLYRGTHGTFEDYCQGRWGISRSYAHRTIGAVEVVNNLLPIGNILPATESQARPLTALAPEQQREAWAKAVEDAPSGKPTAADVQKAAATFAAPKPTKPQPIQYAKINQLEERVRAFVERESSTGDEYSVEHILDALRTQTRQSVKGGWLDQLMEWIVVAYRKSDLVQAINNVRDQRRQAKLQASGRAVYVEPKPEPMPEPDDEDGFDVEPTPDQQQWQQEYEASLAPDELEAVALVAAEQAEEDAERAERDAARPSFENVPEVVEAVAPDPRIAEARAGMELITAGRAWVRDNYLELTGLEVNTLAYWRDTAMMLERLQSLVDILTRKEVSE